jgi:hypothetical protein
MKKARTLSTIPNLTSLYATRKTPALQRFRRQFVKQLLTVVAALAALALRAHQPT